MFAGLWPSTSNFYPRPPRGGRRAFAEQFGGQIYFYPRPPRGGRPAQGSCLKGLLNISIHALREEGDLCSQPNLRCHTYFYPRPPRGGRRCRAFFMTATTNFYPRPPRGGRHAQPEHQPQRLHISIHALREEGDRRMDRNGPQAGAISIHALREEGDHEPCAQQRKPYRFLSTPSARRATSGARKNTSTYLFLSTPSARRATSSCSSSGNLSRFLSTPSARRATLRAQLERQHIPISIHALREEGDSGASCPSMVRKANFYPRPPRGGRPRIGHLRGGPA